MMNLRILIRCLFPLNEICLYHNNRNGTFTEVAITAGVADQGGKSLSASWCDFNNDGWPDLYVANDVTDNVMYINMRGWNLQRNVSHLAHVADYRGAMGLAVGDWDNNGTMDLFVTHWLAEQNGFYINKFNESQICIPGFNFRMRQISLALGRFRSIMWDGVLHFLIMIMTADLIYWWLMVVRINRKITLKSDSNE